MKDSFQNGDAAMVQEAADILWQARGTCEPCPSVARTYALSEDLAYCVQETNVARAAMSGRTACGWKVGLTSAPAQAMFQTSEPTYGVLFSEFCFSDGGDVPFAKFIQPRIETEIALIMRNAVNDGDLSLDAFIAQIDFACLAFEIVDCAITGWDISLPDMIADNGCGGAFALGPERFAPDPEKLAGIRTQTFRNGYLASEGWGAACLGNPLLSAHWLAKKLVRNGHSLTGGATILTGALGPMFELFAGDQIEVQCADSTGLRLAIC
jgi:2-keto-4-pentenoate hydratase